MWVLWLLWGCGGVAGVGTEAVPREERVAEVATVDACSVHVAEGVSHLEAGEPLAAERSLMRAVRADRACGAAYLNLSVVQRQTGRLDEALENARRALAIDARDVHGLHQLVLVHLAQAESDIAALDLAALACRQGLQVDEAFAPLHNACGIVDVQRGSVVEALARFERAYTLDPRLFEAWMNFGQITLSFRGYEDAERAFRRALEVEPESYDALIGLGVALRGLARLDEARERYEQARALAPERPEAWYNLGILHQEHLSGQLDDLARAEVYFEAFVQKADGDPDYAHAVEDVMRCCPGTRARRECRPGRLQNVRRAIGALSGRGETQPGC